MFYKNLIKLFLLMGIIFSAAIIFSLSASAATYVSGTISTDTTWTAADSPYIVQDYLEIPQGVTLTINSDVVVKFENSYIDVYGKIIARGDSQNKIYFTSFWDDSIGGDTNGDGDSTTPASYDWYGINFYSPSAVSQFNFSEFRYAGTVFYVDSSDVVLSNSFISFNDYGVYSVKGNLTLQNNAFLDNYIPLYIDYQTNLTNNSNLTSNNNYNGIGLYGSSYYFDFNKTLSNDLPYILFDDLDINENSQLTIEPGVIIKPDNFSYWPISINVYGTLRAIGADNEKIIFTSLSDDLIGGDTNGDGSVSTPDVEDWGGIYFAPSSFNSRFENAVIKYGDDIYLDSVDLNFNKITTEENNIGIFIWQGLLILNNSEIKNNYDGEGIVILDGSVVISKTDIYDNFESGIFVLSGSLNVSQSKIYGNLDNGINVLGGSAIISQTQIYDNIDNGVFVLGGTVNVSQSSIHDNSSYGIYNSTAGIINAENNWWGNASGPYHATLNLSGTGNKVSNNVAFIPWLTSDPLLVNNSPTLANINQFKSDGITIINENGITQDSTIVFKAALNDSDNDQVKLEIELRQSNEPFTGADDGGILTSAFISSGGEVVVSRQLLVVGSYHWRARVVDSRGGASDWQEFGIQRNIDFTVGRAIKVAVILAEPFDVSHRLNQIIAQPCKLIQTKTYQNGHSKEYYDDLVYCVEDYYLENSYGLVNLDFTIFDNGGQWYKITDSAKTESYYGNDKENEFVADVINLAANNGVNFSNQDIIVVLHAGTSEQVSGNTKLSTQTWPLINHPLGYFPYKIIIAEDDPVGVFTHETGHIIGALLTLENTITPDLYKMGDIRKWDLMAQGSWNGGILDIGFSLGDGTNPSYISSYVREFFNWLNYQIYPKSAYGEHWINSLETTNYGDSIFRYNLEDNTSETTQKYYILEARNRNLKNWDSSLPGLSSKHLILYYVDEKGFPEYGYNQDGMMNNQHRLVTIPGNNKDNNEINDGILNPSINETYRDFDNLVKFSAISDRTIGDKYEIQAKIETISLDSFTDAFWGIVFRPSLVFQSKIVDKNIQNSYGEAEVSPRWSQESYIALYRLIFKFIFFFIVFILFSIWFFSSTKSEKAHKIIKVILWILLIINISVFVFFTIQELVEWYKIRYISDTSFIEKLTETLSDLIVILSPVLLILFLSWFFSLKSERVVKIIKISLKILLLLSIITFIGFYILLRIAYNRPDIQPPPGVIRNPSAEIGIFSDLDLHAITLDGRHIGVDYQTGEYETQIANAIYSGDNQGAPEWIFVPSGVEVRYYISSRDNEQFLNENPDIAAQITDTSDSYEIYARYLDPQTGVSTSQTLTSQPINPGENIIHQTIGTTDIIITPGVVDETPPEAEIYFDKDNKQLKVEGVDNLLQTSVEQQNKSFVIKDGADNTLTLVFDKLKQEKREIKAEIKSLQYNEELIIEVESELKYEWALDKNGGIKELEQRVEAEDGFDIKAKYSSKKDETKIIIKYKEGENKIEYNLPGLVIIKLITKSGVLNFEF